MCSFSKDKDKEVKRLFIGDHNTDVNFFSLKNLLILIQKK